MATTLKIQSYNAFLRISVKQYEGSFIGLFIIIKNSIIRQFSSG